MAIGASVAGGTHHNAHAAVHSRLSAAEHHAASQVLAKLGLHSSSALSRSGADSVKVGSQHVSAGSTTLTHSKTALSKPTAGTDKVVAGSAHSPSVNTDKVGKLASAKISSAGATAASVKEHTSHVAKAKATKMTGSDKTTVHVAGVSVHDLTKGGGGHGSN